MVSFRLSKMVFLCVRSTCSLNYSKEERMSMWRKISIHFLENLDPELRRLLRPRNYQYSNQEDYWQIQKIAKQYGFLAEITPIRPAGYKKDLIKDELNQNFFESQVFSRLDKKEAMELFKCLLKLPINPSERTHIWVTSLLSLGLNDIRWEVETARNSAGMNSEAWAEARRVFRDQLTNVPQWKDHSAYPYLREVSGMPGLPPSPILQPIENQTEKDLEPIPEPTPFCIWKRILVWLQSLTTGFFRSRHLQAQSLQASFVKTTMI